MECHAPVTVKEIFKAISNVKIPKACSMNDRALNKYLKYSKDAMLPIYCKLYNLILNIGIMPEVRKRSKIRNRYNQASHLTQYSNGKVTTPQLDITNESQEVSPFPAGDHKASTNRHA